MMTAKMMVTLLNDDNRGHYDDAARGDKAYVGDETANVVLWR